MDKGQKEESQSFCSNLGGRKKHYKKILLKIRQSIRKRNFATPNKPPKNNNKNYFNPKVALPQRLQGVKIINKNSERSKISH
jgi:hypothetical protein